MLWRVLAYCSPGFPRPTTILLMKVSEHAELPRDGVYRGVRPW